ncbi:deoxyxylulose-5-phosphate synthase [Streptomyces sp. NBC_00073]|uniref:deoxyxylulose-5-phosphate synthase n=1 Tax=Streptomyces sp. NBC_00073 TaxID=2975640 RepID=UPI0032562D59
MPHRFAYVCTACRISLKRDRYDERGQELGHRCPRCRRALVHAGDSFEAPPRRDVAAWRVVAVLLDAGIGFQQACCGCGPGYRPRSLREVRERARWACRTGRSLAGALVTADLP